MEFEEILFGAHSYIWLFLSNNKEIEIGYYKSLIRLNHILLKNDITPVKF